MELILRKKLKNGRFINVSPERSRMMGNIRSKGNRSTEKSFRFALVRAGISGWVLHPKRILGTPDFYFAKENVAIFVDGCFWHGCRKCGHLPATRSVFWRTKFEHNKLKRHAVSDHDDSRGLSDCESIIACSMTSHPTSTMLSSICRNR